MDDYILVIDQGTTSSRAIIFDRQQKLTTTAQREFTQYFPQDGWVEHDAEEIWQVTLAVCQQAITQAQIQPEQIAGLGITNQRETTVVWDAITGQPVARAIVWQDRRTAADCKALAEQFPALSQLVQDKTGLLLDPYFSATKLRWLLNQTPTLRQQAEAGRLRFGTIDSFLLWRLTDGQTHATDATNASRTMLFNIHTQVWDDELLTCFQIPASLLPTVQDSASHYGHTAAHWFGTALPISAIAGDQQAALIGQACFKPGMIKSTYGTGCFVIQNTGTQPVQSKNRLLTTIAYRLNGIPTYAIEGSIFAAGAAMQWLRDGLKLIQQASDSEQLAMQTPDTGGVYLVPAFTGLGAPYWDPFARGAILGLTRDTGIKEIVTAGLQAVCYQTCDLLNVMREDGANLPLHLRVDGGMSVNNWLMQFLADMLDLPVERPALVETTALGVSYLVGLQLGWYRDLDEISQLWESERLFTVQMTSEQRLRLYGGWQQAIEKVKSRSCTTAI